MTQALLTSLGIKMGKLPTRYNIAPTENVPVVFEHEHDRKLNDMRWWLVPSWSKGPSNEYAMFNARSESIAKSPAFRGPFKKKRCIVPASSFIEWQKNADGKQPFMIDAANGKPLAFAGLWDYWEPKIQDEASNTEQGIYSCTIVTTQAARSFEQLHKRMPVILNEEHFDLWLDPSVDTQQLTPLFAPVLPYALRINAISKQCNNARHKEAPEILSDLHFDTSTEGEIIH